MERQEAIKLMRSEIDRLKETGVPGLMKEPRLEDVPKLEKIADDAKYSDFEYELETTPEELALSGDGDALASVLYIWGNRNWEYGDGSVFNDWEDYHKFLQNEGGERGKKIAKIQRDCPLSCNEITLSQLLGLEKIDGVDEDDEEENED